MARYDDLNTNAIAYATFVSSILLVVIILLVRALCYSWVGGEDARKIDNSHYVQSDTLIAEQIARISNYDRVEVEVVAAEGATAGEAQPAEPKMEERFHIPIEDAKKLILKELAAAAVGSET